MTEQKPSEHTTPGPSGQEASGQEASGQEASGQEASGNRGAHRDRDAPERGRDRRDEARGHERGGRDTIGSVADEALKLIEALQERATRDLRNNLLKGTAAGLGQAFAGRKERDVWAEAVQTHHDDEYICRACPVCRVIAAQRESGSDVAGHLVAAGGELLTAVRQALEALQRPAGPRGPRRGRPDVEHIDLG